MRCGLSVNTLHINLILFAPPIVTHGLLMESVWAYSVSGPDLRAQLVPRPPTNRGPPTEPFIFYLSLMIDAYETTT